MPKTKYKYTVREILIKLYNIDKCGWMREVREVTDMLQEKVEKQFPRINNIYYFICDEACVSWLVFRNNKSDQYRLKTNNVFRSRQEAEQRLKEVMK